MRFTSEGLPYSIEMAITGRYLKYMYLAHVLNIRNQYDGKDKTGSEAQENVNDVNTGT